MVSRETQVTAGFVVLAIPASYAVQFLVDGYVGDDTALAIGFATLVLVGVGGPQAYRWIVDESA